FKALVKDEESHREGGYRMGHTYDNTATEEVAKRFRVAEKEYKTHEKDTEKNKEKSEKDFKEFIEYLKQSQPHYLGSQELISIDKQLNKIKKKD
ncbi:hypothetical protein LCGC14_2516420, partial [marine sediment metagenome]